MVKCFCNRCANRIDLNDPDAKWDESRYYCDTCGNVADQTELLTQDEVLSSVNRHRFAPIHYCSSCDEPIWSRAQLNTLDSCGRCERCQEEYGDVEEEEYFDN